MFGPFSDKIKLEPNMSARGASQMSMIRWGAYIRTPPLGYDVFASEFEKVSSVSPPSFDFELARSKIQQDLKSTCMAVKTEFSKAYVR